MKYLLFYLDAQPYGLAVDQVVSVERLNEIEQDASSGSDDLIGYDTFRGATLPVYDLAKKLRVIGVRSEAERVLWLKDAGYRVDSMAEVAEINDAEIQKVRDRRIALHREKLIVLLDQWAV